MQEQTNGLAEAYDPANPWWLRPEVAAGALRPEFTGRFYHSVSLPLESPQSLA